MSGAIPIRHGLAVLGALALTACVSNAPPRSDRPDPPPVVAPAPVATPTARTAAEPVATEVAPASPWQRMRERLRMPGCDYSSAVQQRAAQLARSPQRFAASWRPAMPFLLLALDAIERRDLPGEFALLPYVESNYRPIATQGMRPAGVWQLMPHTARAHGLHIDRAYDGRLDMPEATRVALDLLERQDREFADWRLATMAFNAGEYRVKNALGRRNPAALDAEALARLKLSPTTHEHLTRLLALACIVADPQRFSIELPEPHDADHLLATPIEGTLDLRIAARFAGMPEAELRRLNAGHLGERTAASGPPRLLLPRDRHARFAAAQEAGPGLLQAHWMSTRIARTAHLAAFADDMSITPQALALANGIEADATLEAGATLLVPGHASEPAPAADTGSAVHVVRHGDTLSALARRYRVRVAQLLDWNRLTVDSTLRLGARLRVRAP